MLVRVGIDHPFFGKDVFQRLYPWDSNLTRLEDYD
jgi:hypothetical protein